MNLKSVLTIVKKDLRIEFRTKHTITSMLLFAGITLLVFSYIFQGVYIQSLPDIGPGILWTIFIFTGMIGLSRAFVREKELGTLEGLKLSPVSPEEILTGKIVYNFILMLIVTVIVFPLFIVFLNFPVKGSAALALFLLALGNLGFVVVGSAISMIVMNARARELLLPVVLLPVLFPLIMASVGALNKVLVDGAGFINITGEVKIITAYTGIMLVISLLTFEYALEE
ncbi:MAG: heme exporter protein CcmB [Candidatus Hydrothermarchaeaceae archaeon]